MPQFIDAPTRVTAAGTPPKSIEEFVGRASTGDARLSVARMVSPSGWSEPWQQPAFDEWTIVLRGAVLVKTDEGSRELTAGQAVWLAAGERVRYSTPGPEGAEYVAVCLPAFSPETVQRDADDSPAT